MFSESELVIENTDVVSRLGEIVMTFDKGDVHEKIALQTRLFRFSTYRSGGLRQRWKD